MREARSPYRSSGKKRMRCTSQFGEVGYTTERIGELERRCQEVIQEVELLSERQEVLKGMVEDMIRLQSRATEKYYEQIFEEVKELEKKKSKEAL